MKRYSLLIVCSMFLLCTVGCETSPERSDQPFPLLFGPQPAASYLIVETDDDWRIPLAWYKPKEIIFGRKKWPVVVLCHDLGLNGAVWQLRRSHDLPRFLRDAGCEVCAVQLRGAGASYPLDRQKGWNWTIDDIMNHDVPSILRAVRKIAGEERSIFWIGHGLGATAGLVYEANHPGTFEGIVAIAPVGLVPDPPNDCISDKELLVKCMESPILRMPPTEKMRGGEKDSRACYLFWAPENVQLSRLSWTYWSGMVSVPPRAAEQFSRLAVDRRLKSFDRKRDYVKEMEKASAPVLFVVGSDDSLAEVGTVREMFHASASTDKTFLLLSLANGQKDYGHYDILFGDNAPAHLYPAIRTWLNKHGVGGFFAPPTDSSKSKNVAK